MAVCSEQFSFTHLNVTDPVEPGAPVTLSFLYVDARDVVEGENAEATVVKSTLVDVDTLASIGEHFVTMAAKYRETPVLLVAKPGDEKIVADLIAKSGI